jgi:hypothetical protein
MEKILACLRPENKRLHWYYQTDPNTASEQNKMRRKEND